MPATVASTVQVPAANRLAVAPEIVHTVGVVEAKLTGRPELAMAVRLSVVSAYCAAIAAKLIVWVAWWTVKLCETVAAAA